MIWSVDGDGRVSGAKVKGINHISPASRSDLRTFTRSPVPVHSWNQSIRVRTLVDMNGPNHLVTKKCGDIVQLAPYPLPVVRHPPIIPQIQKESVEWRR